MEHCTCCRVRIDADAFLKMRSPRVCAVEQGGTLLMRPLLPHASFPARVPGHRRVVHLDFAANRLPGGLRWSAEVLT